MVSRKYRELYEREPDRQAYMYSERAEVYSHNRVKHIVESLIRRLAPQSMLDVGCAEGAYLRFACGLDISSFGVDIAISKIRRSKGYNSDIPCFCADSQRLPFHDDMFELVISLETIEHVPDYRAAYNELFRVSKKYVIISVPVGLAKGSGHLNFFYENDFKSWAREHKLISCYGIFTNFMPFRRTISLKSFSFHKYIEFFDSLFCTLPFFRYSGTHIVLVFEK